jgi:hypothetical protein
MPAGWTSGAAVVDMDVLGESASRRGTARTLCWQDIVERCLGEDQRQRASRAGRGVQLGRRSVAGIVEVPARSSMVVVVGHLSAAAQQLGNRLGKR